MMTEAPPVRAGIRAGVWSLLFALLGLIWVVFAAVLAIWALSDSAPGAVSVTAYILLLLGLFVVPIAAVVAVVLGIVALLRNRVAGKVLGGIALLLGLGSGIVVVSLILGSGGFLGAISF